MNNSIKPVFFDPTTKRWPKIKFGLWFSASLVSAVFLLLIFSIITSPVLSYLALPTAKFLPSHQDLAGRQNPSQSTRRLAALKARLEAEATRSQKQTKQKASADLQTVGFYVNWDDASLTSLKKHLASLDTVIGEFMHLSPTQADLTLDNPDKEKAVISYIRQTKPDTKIIGLINNFGQQTWDSQTLSNLLSDKQKSSRLITAMLQHARDYGLDGFNLDFESLPAADSAKLTEFTQRLYAECRKQHLILSLSVPADNADYDYTALADTSDYLILMAYDQHWATGQPGPIAGVDWFGQIVEKRLAEIPNNKLIVAIGSYAYDWPSGQEAQAQAYEESIVTAQESQGDIKLDPASLNPYYSYYDEQNRLHDVWFLDAASAFDQLALLHDAKPLGAALWRLGSEDPGVWPILDAPVLDQQLTKALAPLNLENELFYEGKGELLRVSKNPQAGLRQLTFDNSKGMIVAEHYLTLPLPYVIERYGYQPKKIALTFDDGPDNQYTPKILDILKQYKAPATFFFIGSNAEKYPSLITREWQEGHDIGSHTYTHPNIAEISPLQLRLEVAATNRLLESIINRQTILFRSPYAEDSEPNNTQELAPILELNQLGYINVGMGIDPSDWRQPPAAQIASSTISQAEQGRGNVILLHDAGGSREQTIAALPLIIDGLRAKGYQLVTVSELLGRTRDQTMPLAQDSKAMHWTAKFGLWLIGAAGHLLGWLFAAGIILGISRLLFIIALAIWQKKQQQPANLANAAAISTAVIVPAYNEEKVINQTIASLLEAGHPDNFEIIVIDDGSTDNTLDTVSAAFGQHPKVKIFTQPNSGKPKALNFGINQTQAEVIITLDADTVFTPQTISQLVCHFTDQTIAAVAGNAKVGNRLNLMTSWQALEYITSQNLDRRALTILNNITVVPGAVGAWRRSVVLQAGGFADNTLAEDADLTVSILRLGYRIIYDDQAIALTEAPASVRDFTKQRYRWMFGMMQMAWKHKNLIGQPRAGWLGNFTLPNIFVYQVFFPLISPLMDLSVVVNLIAYLISRQQHPLETNGTAWHQVLFYYALFILVDFLAALIAFLLEKNEDKRLLAWLLPQRFFYRQLMYWVAIKSLASMLKGHEVGWNKLERQGTVKN
ncbi:MAG: polysaccharide deacetylase family protein [Candidatus Falkowbacteria bacterium]